ncbi:hypothetical protein RclHR1_20340004 [Rhizophagus clarus]|uniref:Uncharacterized protein n=1 Tax=Rhizophagus clarus TaxID=94130 RepID=A0A2Z6QT62_9GLOM|nr:hypothetical protein RclHR1_20340004 [Rhizophagus clarus]
MNVQNTEKQVPAFISKGSSELWNCQRISEQNLFVSAFQAEFLLKILAGLHISKNTKHTGSDSISKVQNSNSKQTEVLNFISRRTTIQNSIPRQTTKSRTPFQGGPLSETLFQDGLLSSELHFEADHCLKLYFEADRVKQIFNFESRLYSKKASVFNSRFKVCGWIPKRNIEGLECYGTSKFGNFPDAFWVDMGFQRSTTFWTHHRQNFEGLQLLNATGLNFEASERNFKGPKLPEHLMDRISEVCSFIMPYGRNFKDLWLFRCFLKDFKGI